MQESARRLMNARRVAVLTGAGVSAESGVPTFRGENGLWRRFKPEELANFEAFMENPKRVWEWYQFRRDLIDKIQPNPGHRALAVMQDCVSSFALITQNVDGLHQRSGNRTVLELHGNIMRSRCIECGARCEEVEIHTKGELPRCGCGGLLRPDVVWFGEMLPEETLSEAYRISAMCDVFLVVGTSALVQPAASLPLVAKENGAYVIEVNPETTEISGLVDVALRGKSGEILPQLVMNAWGITV